MYYQKENMQELSTREQTGVKYIMEYKKLLNNFYDKRWSVSSFYYFYTLSINFIYLCTILLIKNK